MKDLSDSEGTSDSDEALYKKLAGGKKGSKQVQTTPFVILSSQAEQVERFEF